VEQQRPIWHAGRSGVPERRRPRQWIMSLTWTFKCGAGDGNRTRTTSLEDLAMITVLTRKVPDLHVCSMVVPVVAVVVPC
jgi:hypothetical protein